MQDLDKFKILDIKSKQYKIKIKEPINKINH